MFVYSFLLQVLNRYVVSFYGSFVSRNFVIFLSLRNQCGRIALFGNVDKQAFYAKKIDEMFIWTISDSEL